MYAKDFLKKAVELKTKDSNKFLEESTKGTLAGAAIGATVGLIIGLSRHKNLLMCGFVGSLIGGGISRFFIMKK